MIIFMQVKRSRWMKVWLSARVGFKFRVGLGGYKTGYSILQSSVRQLCYKHIVNCIQSMDNTVLGNTLFNQDLNSLQLQIYTSSSAA